MIDEADARHARLVEILPASSAEQILARGQRLVAGVAAAAEQGVEGEEDQVVGFPRRQRRLETREVRRAVRVQRHDLAVDDAVAETRGGLGQRGELLRPVQTLARQQRRDAGGDPQLHAIAVELDLVDPAGLGRRPLDQLAQLRRHEARHGHALGALLS